MNDEIIQKTIDIIETHIPMLMARRNIPGLSIALVNKENIFYAKGFGARNREDNIPATEHTLYGIGSCSKSFTALSVMQLVDKGKIDLYDPVSKYVPFKLGLEDKPITIHHLLSHSSGIPSLGTSTILRSALPIPMSSFNDHYRFINGAQSEIANGPGERFFYLNAGYATLQDIVQRVSGMRLDEYITRNILRPLEMKRSIYSEEDFYADPDRMVSYIRDKDGNPIRSKPVIHELLFGRGGLLCPVTELTNYLTANINNGKFGDVELLNPELMKEMHKIHIETQRGWYGKQGYGYGWSVLEDFLGAKMIMHGGSIAVSGGNLAFMPKEKVGIAMGYNMLPFPAANLVQMIFATLLDKDPKEVLPMLKIEEKLKMLAGNYETYRGISKAEIVERDGLLYFEQVTDLGKSSVPLIPASEEIENYEFYIYSNGVKSPVNFVVDCPSKVNLYMGNVLFHKIY